jgi:hypothetical protein
MQSLRLLAGASPQLRGRPRIQPRLSEINSLNTLPEGRSPQTRRARDTKSGSRIVVAFTATLTGRGIATGAGDAHWRKALLLGEAQAATNAVSYQVK